MTKFNKVLERLKNNRQSWLVTGAAGFIGSNLVEALLRINQTVIGLDNFSTGLQCNLSQVEILVGAKAWSNFRFIRGDICDLNTCREACNNVDFVLHHAALGSVPHSIEDPLLSNHNNVTGFVNMLVAARDARTKRFVYASSSATYGDHPALPQFEDQIGKPLSPYAVTKYVNELYADVFARCYGIETVGLRYFNIFGPRQDPDGAYAAVIPKWIAAMIKNEALIINGDGETSRDFCYVENAVQANILSAVATNIDAVNEVYNVAVNERTTLNQLFDLQRELLINRFPHLHNYRPLYQDFHEGDIRHSQGDIGKAHNRLGYVPSHHINDGLKVAMDWYIKDVTRIGGL